MSGESIVSSARPSNNKMDYDNNNVKVDMNVDATSPDSKQTTGKTGRSKSLWKLALMLNRGNNEAKNNELSPTLPPAPKRGILRQNSKAEVGLSKNSNQSKLGHSSKTEEGLSTSPTNPKPNKVRQNSSNDGQSPETSLTPIQTEPRQNIVRQNSKSEGLSPDTSSPRSQTDPNNTMKRQNSIMLDDKQFMNDCYDISSLLEDEEAYNRYLEYTGYNVSLTLICHPWQPSTCCGPCEFG